jgi:hypothetical protein
MRYLIALVAVLLTACGGSDGPAAPAPAPIAAVRAESPVWFRDTVSFTARNVGRAAQWRITAWGDGSPCPVGTPNNIGCDPQPQCAGAAALIAASATIPIRLACGARFGFDWIVIETQDPSSPAFVRTACIARVGACPTALQPER